MPRGVYKRKPRTPEHCAALKNSKAAKAAAEALRRVPRSHETCAKISATKTGVPQSPEHTAAIKEAKTGVPHSPEQIAAIIEGQKESGMYEAMRGGNDLVTHHYIYDHSDLSLNTVKMTRSDHSRLHALLRKLGYVVPHINV